MTYGIDFHPAAERELEKLSTKDREKVVTGIEALSHNPRPPKSEKMSALDAYRLRIGDYRVIYSIEDQILVILVVKVAKRKDAYRDLPAIRKRLNA